MTESPTAGPWRVEPDLGWSLVVDADGILVARVSRESDARLISAAPDLLAACRRAATLLWHARTGPDDPIRAALDAAVQKATGASS